MFFENLEPNLQVQYGHLVAGLQTAKEDKWRDGTR